MRTYNDSVTVYNTAVKVFPAVIIAGSFGFKDAPLWELEEEEARQAPKVSFN